MTDADLLLTAPDPEFGSGVIGVCDVCGKRQAVIVLSKERFQLCVIDFLNKKWTDGTSSPGAPLPPYRSERIWFPTQAVPSGRAPAILLSPTKIVKHPGVLFTPDAHGLTTAILDGAIRTARAGFEVLLPDVGGVGLAGPLEYLGMTFGVRGRGGIDLRSASVGRLTQLYGDALAFLRSGAMIDPDRSAVFGIANGGALAISLAAQDQKLSALVLAYPAPVRPPEMVSLVGAPVLVVAGRRDRSGSRGAHQLVKGLPEGQVRWVEAGEARAHFLARDLSGYDLGYAESAWAEMVGFLKGRLFPPPPKPPAPPVARPAAGPASPSPAPAAPPARA